VSNATLRTRPRLALVSGLTAIALATAAISADTLIVNPAAPGAFADIQAAVNAAAPGDTIVVFTGTYAPVTIATNNLTLKAQKGQTPVVDAMGLPIPAIWVQSDGVTITGLTAINAGVPAGPAAPPQDGFGFFVTGSNAVLRDNTAMNSAFGFLLYTGGGHKVVQNTSTGNDFGLALFDTSNNMVVNNELSGNNVLGLFMTATNLAIGANNNTITNNNASDNFHGIAMTFGAGNHFSGNTSDRNTVDGIRIQVWASDNLFTGNLSRDNGRYGVFVVPNGQQNTYRGMILTGNGAGASNIPLR
jgi:parallel beta-helix repeat protein